jgi:hypothetical protein
MPIIYLLFYSNGLLSQFSAHARHLLHQDYFFAGGMSPYSVLQDHQPQICKIAFVVFEILKEVLGQHVVIQVVSCVLHNCGQLQEPCGANKCVRPS